MNIHQLFQTHFTHSETRNPEPGTRPFTVRAPGRVNLIGEHVDYNNGFVLPMAVPMQTLFRLRPRQDRTVEIYSANFDEKRSFSLDDIEHRGDWMDYVRGVARELAAASVPLHGFEGVLTSDVPVASGLSSSAAIEVGACLAFTHLAEQPMAPRDVALLCQRAENRFVGVNSGIMDQMAVAACEANHALLLDCRSLDMEQVPFQLQHHSIVVTDSGAPRELAASAYNERRAQCEEGLARLREGLPQISSLRDVSPDELDANVERLSPVVRRRVEHVVGEIARTLRAVESLKAGDLAAFGRAMNESHASLSRLYEVTSPELDWLCEWAMRQPGTLGSRMTGAGFGGCTVTLIENAHVESFIVRLPQEYKAAMNRDAHCWICTPQQGAQVS